MPCLQNFLTLYCYIIFQHNFPRTLEALILPLLSPAGAKVLTQKFDEMDEPTFEEVKYLPNSCRLLKSREGDNRVLLIIGSVNSYFRNLFYQVFYGAFDNQFYCNRCNSEQELFICLVGNSLFILEVV
uniref:Uncharacterized protein n=1 Tax=Rhizophora mucronata TaxID=61149 RepID=A0A2P2PKN8_RHIMU